MKKTTKNTLRGLSLYSKIKRFLALAGVIVLVGLYLSTLFCALSTKENFMDLLMASIYATVIFPVLLWAYSFIYRLFKGHTEDEED